MLGVARLTRRPRPAMVIPDRGRAGGSSPRWPARRRRRADRWCCSATRRCSGIPRTAACLMYGVHGHTWVALGEPIGPSSEAEGLVAQFLERCDDYSGLPVVYQASKDWLHVFTDYGLTFVTLGEDARVFLPHFAIDGSGHRAHAHDGGAPRAARRADARGDAAEGGAAASVAGRGVRRVACRAGRRRAGLCGEPLRPALHLVLSGRRRDARGHGRGLRDAVVAAGPPHAGRGHGPPSARARRAASPKG